jgi:hypothetical protein
MNEIKQEIKRLHESGYSNAAISARIGRPSSWIWEQIRDLRRDGHIERLDQRAISLPTVSILESGMNTTEDDFRAGKAAASAAGLS